MDSIIHADIFFLVSTVTIIVISIGLVIALIYIIRILKNVTYVSSKVKEETDEILSDVKTLRGHIKAEGFKVKYITAFLSGIFKRKKSSKKNQSNG